MLLSVPKFSANSKAHVSKCKTVVEMRTSALEGNKILEMKSYVLKGATLAHSERTVNKSVILVANENALLTDRRSSRILLCLLAPSATG